MDMLDVAGIRRAVVLSEAFWIDSPFFEREGDLYERVRAENDWTVREAARYPGRLVPFCSFNPLRDYAVREVRRCSSHTGVKGIKLSFGMSGVDLKKTDHVARVRNVFREANRRGLALVVHVRDGESYGANEASTFVDELVAAAPDVTVQIAHLWGGEHFSEDALAVYADAVSKGLPGVENLYFDVAEIAVGASEESLQTMAERIRQIGVERILYGSDAALEGRLPPREGWKLFASSLPLTADELISIAENAAPYLIE